MRVAIRGLSDQKHEQAPPLPLIDNPFAPELLATSFSGFANIGGLIVLTLESAHCDHSRQPPALERVVVGRVALTVSAAQNLVTALHDFLDKQGFNPSRAAAGAATFQ